MAARSGHVPLHKLWSFATQAGELSAAEQTHLQGCDNCRHALNVCLKAESFAAAVKELDKQE
jgi:hypothetical protein